MNVNVRGRSLIWSIFDILAMSVLMFIEVQHFLICCHYEIIKKCKKPKTKQDIGIIGILSIGQPDALALVV